VQEVALLTDQFPPKLPIAPTQTRFTLSPVEERLLLRLRQARRNGYEVAVIDLDGLTLWLSERGNTFGDAKDKAQFGIE
jgi:hypothetical protein